VPPAVYVYPAPVVYGPRFVAYGPYWRQRYWRR
jgi:hypothetical protein